MIKYFTGTTLECARKIVNEGLISTNPPQRVWETYSKDFVYMLSDKENGGESLEFALEQSAYALYKLGHTRRVIFVLKDLDESLIERDTDVNSFDSLKYSDNISMEFVEKIYVETYDNSDKNRQLIALTELNEQYSFNMTEYEDDYYGGFLTLQDIAEDLSIKSLDAIPDEILFDEDKLEIYYMELIEWHRRTDLFTEFTVKEFKNSFIY